MNSSTVTVYKDTLGNEIELSPTTVRNYLVSGTGAVNDQEILMFIALCKFQKLNPFLKEAYLIKYGNAPASIITGKEAFTKRAAKNPKYEGHETGISEDGLIAWAKVYVKGYRVPIQVNVDFEEYVGKKGDGSTNKQWTVKPKTMLKKVALVQALREAFPEELGGMYAQEEVDGAPDGAPTKTPPASTNEKEIKETPKDEIKPTQEKVEATLTPYQRYQRAYIKAVGETSAKDVNSYLVLNKFNHKTLDQKTSEEDLTGAALLLENMKEDTANA